MSSEAEDVIRALVGEIARRLGVEPPTVRFVEGAAAVRWERGTGVRVPAHVLAHFDRFGTVPTAAARDVAFAMAKAAERQAGEDDATIVEVKALSFAEAFVRDRVLNR